ncbi:MAG: radical SAM protein [Candidatus Nitrosocaldaceae archaeon]|nr:MAG: radical SAM protein [Candidatus Nitrosocaldaceae archaeon]GIU72122.1 MAG: radical SAM protein [Candidatus Nitrosocaldaceae archaeon]
MKGKKYVLSADRTLMSHYRDNMLFGFIATFPAEKIPPFIYKTVFCPTIEFDKDTGEAFVAPLGLRRVESGLLKEFDKQDVFIAHPDYIEKAIGEDTKIVGLNVMDPRGIGPVPSALTQGKMTPINRISFRNLCNRVKELKKKYNFKVVVGGPGAWQFSFSKSEREEYGIDHVVIGEADDKIVNIYNDIIHDKADEVIFSRTYTLEEIPYIKGPTTNGCIEAMRGCGRGCDFCDPNLRKKRDFPIDRLKEEAMINLRYGITSVWLQSEEILLYGSDNKELIPNKDAVTELFKELKSLPNVNYVGAIHLTFSSAMAEPECVKAMSTINNFGPDRWNGVQVGLETASPSLIAKHMPYKVKPFSPEEWPWVVRNGIKLLNDNYYFVANTLIIGLPGETDDDVRDTIELLKSLDGMATVVAPMFYTDYHDPTRSLYGENMTKMQWELYFRCWYLTAKTVSNWFWYGTAHFSPIMRMIAATFGKFGSWYVLKLIRDGAKKHAGIYLD